jgi:16S rRNA (uracil1498-N3)-methyltransferase
VQKDTDILFVTTSEGYLFETEITLASDKANAIKNSSFEKTKIEISLHMAVAPQK